MSGSTQSRLTCPFPVGHHNQIHTFHALMRSNSFFQNNIQKPCYQRIWQTLYFIQKIWSIYIKFSYVYIIYTYVCQQVTRKVLRKYQSNSTQNSSGSQHFLICVWVPVVQLWPVEVNIADIFMLSSKLSKQIENIRLCMLYMKWNYFPKKTSPRI